MTVADDAPPPRPRPRPRPPARFTHCTCRLPALALVFALLSILQPGRARAQRAVDAQIGTWAVEGADDATLYSAALWRKAWGPLGYSFRALGLIDRGAEDNSLYGLGPELTLLRGQRERAGLSLYGAAGVSLALESSESDVAALWSAGVGLELRAPSLFSASLEARRLVEDTGFHGFWNLAQGDRQGWLLTLGLSFRWGGGSGSAGRAPAPAPAGPTSYPAAGMPSTISTRNSVMKRSPVCSTTVPSGLTSWRILLGSRGWPDSTGACSSSPGGGSLRSSPVSGST